MVNWTHVVAPTVEVVAASEGAGTVTVACGARGPVLSEHAAMPAARARANSVRRASCMSDLLNREEGHDRTPRPISQRRAIHAAHRDPTMIGASETSHSMQLHAAAVHSATAPGPNSA